MTLPKRVRIIEVGPRDGLQNEAQSISAGEKAQLIDALVAAGVRELEAGSFVSPKAVPQMAGSDEVLAAIAHHNIHSIVLTPNLKGLERAIAAGAKTVAVFPATTESFSNRNLNCTVAESMARCAEVTEAALAAGLNVRAYISCVLGCPFEGAVAPAVVLPLARDLLAMGCYEVSLGDTIGVGTVAQVQTLLDTLLSELSSDRLAMHLHDTYGQALANAFAALQLGISAFDASVAGLGGCPFAPGATGNVATEDLVYMFNGLGIEHGIDLPQLLVAGQRIGQLLDRPSASRAAQALLRPSRQGL